ncbi:MAG: tetrahydrofolate dehydrogenase/cyclohydrolase catalytic domain-containing protein [Coriobacteriia bacterium]|nr:tetrahydrofolate dehydrogenase/cyclohydrolase catalytic domain-containing protein [Coriobacteriia bacterium]
MADIIMRAKPVVDEMARDIETRIAQLAEKGITPKLAILRVGAREDDLSYERTALRRAEALGIDAQVFALPSHASERQVLNQVEAINDDDSIHGCLMFRPLPKHINEQGVCDALDGRKDIDGISSKCMSDIYSDIPCFCPATAEACIRLLRHYDISLSGKSVVVVGRSLVIGKPVSMMLLRRNATVTMCHSHTKNLPEVMRAADVVICATGRAKAYGAECFAPGQTVIDVGINFADGKLCGDVDYDVVEPIVHAITPVPGGTGSVTTNTTMEHVVVAAEVAAGIR